MIVSSLFVTDYAELVDRKQKEAESMEDIKLDIPEIRESDILKNDLAHLDEDEMLSRLDDLKELAQFYIDMDEAMNDNDELLKDFDSRNVDIVKDAIKHLDGENWMFTDH